MENNELLNLLKIRIVVGYLGEKDQFNWWPSSFLSPSSDAFLKPVFARTSFLAKYHGVVSAATRVHDERVGLGAIYHLFRMPESIEQKLFRVIAQNGFLAKEVIADKNSAMQLLKDGISGKTVLKEGPVAIGHIDDLGNKGAIDTMVKLYHSAIETGTMVFPYFNK